MNIQSEKLDIIQWVASVNDSKIIRQIMLLKRSSEEITSPHLSPAEKDAINKGLESIEQGRSKLHEEVTEATRKKFSSLFK